MIGKKNKDGFLGKLFNCLEKTCCCRVAHEVYFVHDDHFDFAFGRFGGDKVKDLFCFCFIFIYCSTFARRYK